MSQFYARYVPPSANQSKASSPAANSSVKGSNTAKNVSPSKKRKIEPSQNGDSIIAKYKVTNGQQDGSDTSIKKSQSKEQRRSAQHNEKRNIATNGDSNKHTKVLERFNKSKDRAPRAPEDQRPTKQVNGGAEVHPEPQQQIQEPEPLPQPAPNTTAGEPVIASSTAPEWIANPIRVDSQKRQSFEGSGLDSQLILNLSARGKREALPVQSAVLPLLAGKCLHDRPDLCVAAATGSGKTFAYILPIINALRQRRILRLNAVIVVPTRALVKQVVQSIEQCSDGINIKVGTAEGSTTLKEEQVQLVEERVVYDLKEYEREQQAPIDWATFNPFTMMDELENDTHVPDPGYVKRYFSKVDILICTPGRLVDHLQNTKGFDLDHVQWFVADEADRLLNESYHEWLDLVLPALQIQPTYDKQKWIFDHMHMHLPTRRVTKILLSATMMTDVSQFMALELTNPKLVLVQNQQSEHQTDLSAQDNNYQIPPSLVEHAIALKASQNKPLYLLEVIQKYIFIPKGIENTDKSIAHSEVEDTSSSDGSDASESSSSEDSEDTSDSDTDSGSECSSVCESDSDDSDSSSTTSSASSELQTTSSKQKLPQSLPIRSTPRPRILIFTKSTESAHRLARLLSLLDHSLSSTIQTFTRSSTSNSKQDKALAQSRTKILQSFTSGTTHILISTDLAARGLDIPSLEHVINYDVPASALTYVHRVGRTARAGMNGQAWTLIEHKQGKWFWETVGGKGKNCEIGRGDRVIQKVNIVVDMEVWESRYEEALKKLGEDVRSQ